MDTKGRTAQDVIGRIANGAKGVVTRRELIAEGLSADEINARRLAGILLDEHPGTYRVGHRAPSEEATYMAAVRACGDGALLAGPAAAHVYGLLKGAAPPAEVISLAERRVPGVITHRARRQPGADSAVFNGIPITTVARTLVDLAGVLAAERLAVACHEAGVRYRTTPGQVEAVLRRRPSSRGAGKLRRIMRGDIQVALSRLERRFIERLKEAGLPLPVTNRVAGGHRVDCRWPEHGLTVELDSYRYHNSRRSWENDRRREREARARGDDFRRYTPGDVIEGPALMMRELTDFFRRHSGSRPA